MPLVTLSFIHSLAASQLAFSFIHFCIIHSYSCLYLCLALSSFVAFAFVHVSRYSFVLVFSFQFSVSSWNFSFCKCTSLHAPPPFLTPCSRAFVSCPALGLALALSLSLTFSWTLVLFTFSFRLASASLVRFHSDFCLEPGSQAAPFDHLSSVRANTVNSNQLLRFTFN